MRQVFRFYNTYMQIWVLTLISLTLGFIYPLFLDSVSGITLGLTTGVATGVIVLVRYSSNLENTTPKIHGAKQLFLMPIDRSRLLIAWYISMLAFFLLLIIGFLLGQLLCSHFITEHHALIPPKVIIHQLLTTLILLNILLPTSLNQEDDDAKKGTTALIILSVIVYILYTFSYAALVIANGSNPVFMFSFSACMVLITTIISMRKILKRAPKVEIIS